MTAPASVPASAGAAPRNRILVVDDDATARLLMRAALRKAGFEVAVAAGGVDALAQFGSARFDLVMLDVDMPEMSGHAVCTALRARGDALLPIVMVTGMDDVASVEQAYDCGATDFIAKPINWALIGHRVRYWLRTYQAGLDLRAAQARHAAVLAAIPDLLFEIDLDGLCIDYHSPPSDLLAARAEDFVGKTLAQLLPQEPARAIAAALRSAYTTGSSLGEQFELPLRGRRCWFELSVARKASAPTDRPRFIMLWRDITERKEAEKRIARLAYFDSLTGLPNRQSFLDRVDREIRRAERTSSLLAVLFMDLDGFKGVNDTLGHAAGDQILQAAADRLRDGLRPADMVARAQALGAGIAASAEEGELARLGGDEFTAVALGIHRAEDALSVAHRIGQLMRRPFDIEGQAVTLTASIGIALYPQDGREASTLLKHADTAMYHAKDLGRDNAQLYSASLTQRAVRRMELDASLRAALERSEFHLVYQPKVDVASGRIGSVEALIRWMHPSRGLVSPIEFIPLAERNGLIEPIGRWVLGQACADAAGWARAGRPLCVAVNLSPMQFRDPALLAAVAEVLAHSGLAPELLELEVTESALIDNSTAAIATLHAIRGMGVKIALDDFGTGYSSLSYLTRMPITNLKLDRSFTTGLLDGGENTAVVRAVVAMAGGLGIQVTAEGVETIEQARALEGMACDTLQGYFFSPPVCADALAPLLAHTWVLGTDPAPAGTELAVC